MDKRVAPPSSPELKQALDKLTTPVQGYDFPLFETKQKALMFAAALGYMRRGGASEHQRDTASAIRFDIFEKAVDDGFLYALAIAETNDLKVLDPSREDELVGLFETCASAGLAELNRKCFALGLDPLEALVTLIQEADQIDVQPVSAVDADILRALMGGTT